MRFTIFFLLLAAGSLTACSNEDNKAKSETTTEAAPPAEPTKPETNLGEKPTTALMNVVTTYYSLKDALVATDPAKADPAAARLMAATELFRDEVANLPQFTELSPLIKEVMASSDSLVSEKTNDIEVKRAHFATVSDALFKILKQANLKHGGVYQQFCPMAFNDKGAYWLSGEEEVKNPYFGKKMLECGDVTDSL